MEREYKRLPIAAGRVRRVRTHATAAPRYMEVARVVPNMQNFPRPAYNVCISLKKSGETLTLAQPQF